MVKHIRTTEWRVTQALGRRVPQAAARVAGLVLGIGDDCAIFRPRAGEDLLFTTDMLIEDTHFRRDTHSAADVGWKALARGLSDIAAMGGEPRFCLVSLAVAPWCGPRWVDGFFGGLLRLAGRAGTVLAGGDLSHAGAGGGRHSGLRGGAARQRPAALHGARRRCHLCFGFAGRVVPGVVDRPGKGLEAPSAAGTASGAGAVSARAAARFRRHGFERRAFARSASHVPGFRLERGNRSAAPLSRRNAWHRRSHGGEDYELLFTVRPSARVPAEWEGVPLTRIGTMRKGRAGVMKLAGQPLPPLGYDHFRL